MNEFAVDLDASWGIGDKLHGGYLLAVVAQAGMKSSDPELHPHPVAVSAVYVSPPPSGPAVVTVTQLRAGRSVATYDVSLVAGGQVCVQALLTTGRLPGPDASAEASGPESATTWTAPAAAPPPIAPLEECLQQAHHPRLMPGHLNHLQMALDPATVGWIRGEPGHAADFRGWARYEAGEFDPLVAQFILADALPPVTFDLGLWGWAPTLQLQVLLRRVPDPGWQQIRQTASLIEGGLLDEDCTLWDSAGRITVQARQLAAFREPRHPTP